MATDQEIRNQMYSTVKPANAAPVTAEPEKVDLQTAYANAKIEGSKTTTLAEKAKAVVASPLGMAAEGLDYAGKMRGDPVPGLENISSRVSLPWSPFPTLARLNKGRRDGQPSTPPPEKPSLTDFLERKMPTWMEATDKASQDTDLFEPGESFLHSLGNAMAVHTSRSAAMMTPIGRAVIGLGFIGSEKNEMAEKIDMFSEEHGVEVDETAKAFAVEIAGSISGAIEYSESMILTQAMKGKLLKGMLKKGQLQKMVFGKLGPRVGAFLGSQAIRTIIEGFEEVGQEEVKLLGLLAYTYNQNLKREEAGLEPLPYTTMDEYISKGKKAFQEGVSGGIAGSGIGVASGVAHERGLSKKKAARKLSQETHRDIYLEHKAVREQIEVIGPKVTGHVDAERKEALNQVEEGDLWVKVRELQQNLHTPQEAMPKVEDYEGANGKEQLINFIMANAPMDDQWIERYEQLLYKEVETNTELGAADKLLVKFQLGNPDNKTQDVWALRTILDKIANNINKEDGTAAYPGGINEVAENFTTEIGKEMGTVKFLQAQMENFEEGSLEQLFLEGFITRHVYKNMPVSKAAGFFDVTENEASSVDEAYTQAIANQTRKFQEAIKGRLAQADTEIHTRDVRQLLFLLRDQEDTDTGQLAFLMEGRRLEQELADLGGSINPARDAATPQVQKFLDSYVEVVNNLIYHTMSGKKASFRDSRQVAVNFLGETLGNEFLQMLKATTGHEPFIKPADTPKGLTLQIIEELATQLETETDPVRREEIKRSLKVYQDRAKTQAGSGYTFAQTAEEDMNEGEDVQVVGANVARVIKMLGGKQYDENIAATSAKELYQNSIDNLMKVKNDTGRVGRLFYGTGTMQNEDGKSVENLYVVDEGEGMTPQHILSSFLPAFVSDKEIGEGGGFGMAKIAFLGGSKNFIVHSIAQQKDGTYVATRVEGTGDGWLAFADGASKLKLLPDTELKLAPGLTMTFTHLTGEGIQTGTAFSTEIKDTWDGESWISGAGRFVPDIPVVSLSTPKIGKYNEKGDWVDRSGRLRLQDGADMQSIHPLDAIGIPQKHISTQTNEIVSEPMLIKTFDTHFATIDVILQEPKPGKHQKMSRTSTYHFIPILNRSILQFRHEASFHQEVTLPVGLSINIKPKVGADHQEYPFKFDRENLTKAAASVIEQYLGQLGKGARDKQITMYDEVLKTAPKFESGRIFLDGTQEIPQYEVDAYMGDSIIQDLDAEFAKIFSLIKNSLHRKYPSITEYNRATYSGFMVGTKAYGVHFGDTKSKTSPTTVYLDPQALMTKASQEIRDAWIFLGKAPPSKEPSKGVPEGEAPLTAKEIKFLEDQDKIDKVNAKIKELKETKYVDPSSIWSDDIQPEDEGLSFEEESYYEQIYRRFLELAGGTAVHEAFHQKIHHEGEPLAEEFTFKAGALAEAIVEGQQLVKDSETAEKIIERILEYDYTFSQYSNKQFSSDFIKSQGGYDGYAFSDKRSSQREEGLQQAREDREEEGSRLLAKPDTNRRGLGILVQKLLEKQGMKEQDWAKVVTQAELLYDQGDTAGLYDLIPNPGITLRSLFDGAEFRNGPRGLQPLTEKGVPVTFYHGNRSGLKAADIDPNKIQFGKYGKGLGFTQDKTEAEGHSRRGFEDDGKSGLLEIQIDRDAHILQFNNQQQFEKKIANSMAFNKEFLENHPELTGPIHERITPIDREGVINKLVEGYDAMWIKGEHLGKKIPRGEELVVYNPSIIIEKAPNAQTSFDFNQAGNITTLNDTLDLTTLEPVPTDTRLVGVMDAITKATGTKQPVYYEGEQYKNTSVMVKSHVNFNGDQIKGFEGTLTGTFLEGFTSNEQDIYAYVLHPTEGAQLTLANEIVTEVEGVPFNQEGKKTASSTVIKGTTEFMADGRAHMKFFRTADISTVAHEFMHILSRHMSKEQVSATQLAYVRGEFKNMDDKSKQDFLAKLEIVWDLFMTDPTDPILQKPEAEMLLRGYMEHVARQFEKYLFQGTAPTRALTGAFKSVRDSMRDTYESISAIPDIRADLDPVIKNVFDLMVAGSRAVTTPVAKQVLIEGGVYTVYVSRSSDKIVKTLLKKLREGYSEVQGMHDDILRYAESVMGKKFLRDSDFKLRLSKAGTYAEGKAVIDYIDRQLFQKQKKYHRQMVDEIKQIVGAVEFEKIDKSFGKLIKDEIADIDFKKMTPKKLNSLHGMREWLTTNLRKGIISTDMMNISLAELKQLDRLSQKNIYDFTIQELQMLRDALGTIIKEGEQKQFLRIKKKILILNRESERLVEFGATLTPKDKYSGLEPNPNAKTEEDKVKGALGGLAQAIRIGGRQPHRLLLYIAKFDKDNPLYNFVKIIREGTRVISERHVNDMAFMRDLIASVGGAQHWSKKRIPETETIDERYLSHYKVTNNLGKEVELHLTKAERLSIYMYSLNEDALRHMVEGGIVMPQNKGTGINYKLTPEVLAEMISEITMEEKYVAHQMMQYYQDQVATAINKVSSNLLGYGLAKEENYFPIFAEGKARGNTEVLNKPQLSKTMDQFQRKLIDRMDFLKSRTQSPSPLYIHDAFWAMEMNLQDVNRYVGLAEPLNFVKALWRDTDNKETGIYYSVARSWGPDTVRAIDTWIDRIEDPSTQEGPEGKWVRARRRTAIAAQLGANVFVSMYQRVSLMLATNYDISRASIGQAMIANSGPTQGFGIGAAHSMKEMARLVPELAPRFETGPNVDVHELFMDSMTRHAWSEPKTGMDDIRNIHNWETFKTAVNTLSVTSAMKFIKENDAWALSTIWDAVNIEAKKKGWNEAQIREKFLEIYYNTQPNYDAENISLMMSTPNSYAKIAFSTYQTMPNQIFNEVEYHIREWGVKNENEKDSRTRSMNTIRMIDKVVTTLVAQQMAINMIRELRYLGDDDDEPYWKGVVLGTLRSMIAVLPYVGGLTADLISAFADPGQRYNAFDTPGSFVIQLYKGSGIDAVDMYQSLKDGDLAAAAYSGLRLTAKLLGITKGYAWETALNQIETVTDKLVD